MVKELLKMVPENGMITNEAKRDDKSSLLEIKKDNLSLRELI